MSLYLMSLHNIEIIQILYSAGAETEIIYENYIYIIAADVQALCVVRPSADMVYLYQLQWMNEYLKKDFNYLHFISFENW